MLSKVSQYDPDELNFFESWKMAFELSMGGFDNSSANALKWFVFFFTSLVDVIWMLNLLVSLLGTAYDDFSGQVMAEDVQAQVEIVCEIEQINLLRTFSDKSSKYLVVFDEKAKEGNPRDEQITLFSLRQELDDRNTAVNARIDKIDAKLDKILQSIKETASINRFKPQ